MIVIIDNYDSFVHNLARYVREAGHATQVFRNDAAVPEEIVALAPEALVISPGPGAPKDTGLVMPLLGLLPPETPVLGVCLGHLCLVEHFGGTTAPAERPLHGEASDIRHDGKGVFQGLLSPIPAGRYHSLISRLRAGGDALIACAWSEEGEIMAIRHRSRPWHGVQFHPESLLTTDGRKMIANFLESCAR